MLKLKSISYSYPGNTVALNGISLHLKDGIILGVAGSSGSGKSTLLNAICGHLDVNSGDVLFNNEKVYGPSRNLITGHKNIRLAGQFHNLQNSLSIFDQIKYKLINYRPDFREKKTMELLQLVGLEEKKNNTPKQLSGGQQQLSGLCCALAEEPLLLLLDEPFNNLDQTAKKNMNNYLISLKENGMSIIIVSHDPVDLLAVSDEIIVLKNGKKIQQDQPEKIFFLPKNEYVAGLFGDYNKLKVHGKNKFIRPSQIKISSKKLKGFSEGKIHDVKFHGNEYHYFIIDKKQKLIAASSEKIKSATVYYKL